MKFKKYKLKSGKAKWKFYHYLGINPDTGKKDVIERHGFNSMAEARTELLNIIKDYEQGRLSKQSELNRMNFKEVVDLWLIHYKQQVKITTFTTTSRLLKKHILPIFKDFYIDRIDIRLCQDAVNDWYSSYSEASLLVSIVSRVFKFGINQGFCMDNPMSKIIRPKNTYKQSYKAPFYDKSELLLFLKTVKQTESLKAYTMFHTLAFTGLRWGELAGLQWRDIDFRRKILSVNHSLIYNEEIKKFQLTDPKTKHSIREIGIDNTTLNILLKWRNYQKEFFIGRGINTRSDEQLVFTTQTNHFITDTYLRRIIRRVTKNYNLPHITIHGFRHTHCSLLFEAGVEMHSVKERLGHSNIRTTMNIYTHVTKSERAKTADIFNDFMTSSNF